MNKEIFDQLMEKSFEPRIRTMKELADDWDLDIQVSIMQKGDLHGEQAIHFAHHSNIDAESNIKVLLMEALARDDKDRLIPMMAHYLESCCPGHFMIGLVASYIEMLLGPEAETFFNATIGSAGDVHELGNKLKDALNRRAEDLGIEIDVEHIDSPGGESSIVGVGISKSNLGGFRDFINSIEDDHDGDHDEPEEASE